MWRKLSIRTQLILMMTFVVSVISMLTLSVVHRIDQKDQKDFAFQQIEITSKSLNNDLLKVILAPSAAIFSDLTLRISPFKTVKGLLILDKNNHPIFKYGEQVNIEKNKNLLVDSPLFLPKNLLLKQVISADGHRFGYSIIDIDLTQFLAKQSANFNQLLVIFPASLVLALFVSGGLSRSFTRPFSKLAQSMAKNDVSHNLFYPVSTRSKNEIGQLFDGYNEMLTTIKDTTEHLRFQSEHDDLTQLYNRFYVEKKATELLSNPNNKLNAMVILDIDQFNIINNSAGFQAGDELLKMIASQCSNGLPDKATFARIGGDDFTLLLEDIEEESALEMINKRLERMADFRFSWEGIAYSVSMSMGVVFFKPNQYSLNQLIKYANNAFYIAKSQGRGKLAIHSEDNETVERYDLEIHVANDIKDALAKKGDARFELFAQAIVPLQYKTDEIGYEILIRMWDSKGNFVPPDNFLPTAERYQLMAEIDMYVLWEFLELATSSPEHIAKLHTAHVNLAGSSLNNPDFQAKVKEAVSHFSFPWNKLELEITETSAVGNFNQAKPFIEYIKNLGIGLALDDFGTGMSSFEYLKSLPFDVVKIDGSFVKDMHTDPSDKAVIRYIHEISELRNQKTVAEYVETEEDVIELTKIGITYGQGYHLGKPIPFTEWL